MGRKNSDTHRQTRYTMHLRGDHSECLLINCAAREKLEADCYEFMLESLAAGIPDDTIEQMAREKFPGPDEWVVDYWWEDHEIMRMESRYI